MSFCYIILHMDRKDCSVQDIYKGFDLPMSHLLPTLCTSTISYVSVLIAHMEV